MRTLRSPKINMTWYLIWLGLVFISQRWEQACLRASSLHSWKTACFLIFAALISWFMFSRYQREQGHFEQLDRGWSLGVTQFFGVVFGTIFVLGLFMIMISYLKAQGHFTGLVNRTDYSEVVNSKLFFDLLATGIIIGMQQQFVSIGFFFNYFFLNNSLGQALGGIFFSGLIFGLLNIENFHLISFFSYCTIGWLLATVYLATQNFHLSLTLGIFVSLLKVILI
ncbi:hypothetical protein HU830_04130 [Lactobacillus sp. DCY120]|uniref:CAAX amino terminal protease family protein n=1 Tax=Bombilactobacillus apium TaxID=2675299 RepID=A0A850R2Y1_9LACO|nr:hypothetical protein [Bombilactobacillus apium]NVY96361.1 hypothetical protein [Bombilactobacillus apium]